MALFTGCGVAIATPFKADGSVDFDAYRNLINWQIEQGIDAIITCGTSGEASTLDDDEHVETIRFCVDVAAGRVPVIGGAGSNDTRHGINLAKRIEATGVDGLLLVTPYYNKCSQQGLIEHYTATADAVSIPCILYSVPGRTGVNIAPATAAELAKHPNIVGIKEASGDISQIAKLMSMADGKVDLYSGNDDQIVPILSLGGIGVISVLSNVAPRQTHEICQKFFDGDVKGSCAEQLRAIPLCKALFCEVNPIPVKMALNLQGRQVGVPKAPLTEMEPENAKKLEAEMKKYGIL